jgi:P pilus assembly chaperone PapD
MLAPGESRELDVDMAPPPGRTERTYRLFFDEIPNAADKRPDGSIAVSFALPIFMPPAQPDRRAEIQALSLENGELRITVANPGNQHVRIESLSVSSGPFRKEVGGWYLLAGAKRAHALPIPAQVCRNTLQLEVRVKTAIGTLERSFGVEPAMCRR